MINNIIQLLYIENIFMLHYSHYQYGHLIPYIFHTGRAVEDYLYYKYRRYVLVMYSTFWQVHLNKYTTYKKYKPKCKYLQVYVPYFS